MEITGAAEEPVITFGSEDLRTLIYPHDDALVFTADIASCIVHRIFVDSGSAVNILYLECLQVMRIEATIEPTNAPLFGFGREIVMPLGFVELPVTLGRADACKTRMIGQQRDQTSFFGPAEERRELTELLDARKNSEKPALISTNDVYNMIELFPGKESFQTKIGSSMSEQIRVELINCLQRNADVFAFSTTDLKGIDRGLAEHRLNVDFNVKPVKQRTRHFGAEKDVAIRDQV
ncbi:uncharacterized protein LOC131023213 [Salvia miltiorrhiza]|uniref:uncharacterized protein LOC131023213 n=1 Tax=Salvia miltiorrhiza TaxID=226208 RepID=UPI0025AB935A|nr:uncharacterized protein LOC131023213 [Salvia miltiorrhiza]